MGDVNTRAFLYRLSVKLHKEESRALVDIHELPARLRESDVAPFDVLLQLGTQGKYKKFEELAGIFKDIMREDLAKEVTTFAKNSKKKKKQARSSEGAQPRDKYANLECALKMTKLQYDILADQIDNLWEAANDARHKRIEELVQDDMKSASELLHKKLLYISTLLASEKSLSPSSSISSTSSNEDEATATINPLESEIQAKSKKSLKSNSLPRNLPGTGLSVPLQTSKQPLLPPTSKTNNKRSCSAAIQCTEDHTSRPAPAAGAIKLPIPAQPTPVQREKVQLPPPVKTQVMQTKPPSKPAPPPKPTKVKPKTAKSGPSQSPKLGIKQNRGGQPVNHKVPDPAAVSVHNDVHDDDDYSELTFTGDSGFSEAKQFIKPELRREPIPPPTQSQQQPTAYMDLCRPTMEPEGYYKTTHEQMGAIREVMKDLPTRNTDQDTTAEYVNVKRNRRGSNCLHKSAQLIHLYMFEQLSLQ